MFVKLIQDITGIILQCAVVKIMQGKLMEEPPEEIAND